ncbi:CS domain-containing protein [Lactobacillus phage CV244]|nr:CS domain-containing protein [Lactobacillus phage CV244]
MALMVNGKKVLGYAIGGNEFYSLDKLKVSVSLKCDFNSFLVNSLYSVSVSLDQPLSPGSAFTLRDLRDKGEKIRLIVTFHNTNDRTAAVLLESDTIDLSKPDSNGNFNFNFQGGNTYYSFDSSDSKFRVYSDAFSMYSGSDYDSGYMQVLYLD